MCGKNSRRGWSATVQAPDRLPPCGGDRSWGRCVADHGRASRRADSVADSLSSSLVASTSLSAGGISKTGFDLAVVLDGAWRGRGQALA